MFGNDDRPLARFVRERGSHTGSGTDAGPRNREPKIRSMNFKRQYFTIFGEKKQAKK